MIFLTFQIFIHYVVAVADYPAPFATVPSNYQAAGVPGVLQATIPWAVSTVVKGAGILNGKVPIVVYGIFILT